MLSSLKFGRIGDFKLAIQKTNEHQDPTSSAAIASIGVSTG